MCIRDRSGPAQDAALFGLKGQNVSRANEITGFGERVRKYLDGSGPVRGTDTGGDLSLIHI